MEIKGMSYHEALQEALKRGYETAIESYLNIHRPIDEILSDGEDYDTCEYVIFGDVIVRLSAAWTDEPPIMLS